MENSKASLRPPLLNHSGVAVAVMVTGALLLALFGGIVFKGRSGWCGTFCPLAPIQKVYGHAPLLMVRNGYCEPCLGCQKNCYDFNPGAAVFSDVYDSDAFWSDNRRFFAALLPGLIIGFFNSVSPTEQGLWPYLVSMVTPPLVSVGLYQLIHNVFRLNHYRLVALFGMLALMIFYWYGAPVVVAGVEQVFSLALPEVVITGIRGFVILVGVAVLLRGLLAERAYRQAEQASAVATVGEGVDTLKAVVREHREHARVKERASGRVLDVPPEQSLLDAIEKASLPIMPGCRMGMCGSDPVVIVEGSENLDPPDENELTTLRRLGLEGKARLACCCKPRGDLAIDLDADPEAFSGDDAVSEDDKAGQAERTTIVIIGNGIAGISTAEHIREQDRDCRIVLITEEPHHFYNRMGLEQVVHGRAAMQGLYLMKEEWYQQNDIEIWLNTRVTAINRDFRLIELGTGERIEYDKLVLATGARAFVPPIPGADMAGCFTLRDAKDALAIRAWVQTYVCKQAVVLGGGVLGIEAADALRQLGLRVTIVHTAHQLMNRQLDLHAGVILRNYLKRNGIDAVMNTSIQQIVGPSRVRDVILTNGDTLPADLLLFCVGVRSNTTLAKKAGLEINHGVLVDACMRTSDAHIYCVGDAAELPGAIGGLWSVGNEQGRVAAKAILGQEEVYNAVATPPVQLKVAGIDLKCFGNMEVEDAEHFTGGDVEREVWRHFLIKDQRLVAGVFVNSPRAANIAMDYARHPDKTLSREDVDTLLNTNR